MMNKNSVYQFFDMSIRYVCLRVGSPEFGIIELDELLQGVARANPEVHGLLTVFLNAYYSWWEYSDHLITQGRGGNLNADEYQQLQTLTKQRDETRKQLAVKVNSLPRR